jgi:putative transposase
MSRQAFYEHRWHQDDRNLGAELILELVDKERGDGRFGTRTLMTMLGPAFAEHHIQIGRDRLFDLLAEHDMLIRPRRHYVHTTDSNHHFRKWSNLIENMEIDRPEQVWVSDITYIRTQNGFLYLSIITDAYSKKVMGFNLSHRLEARGAVAALRMALSQRAYPEQPLIHHSDRGIQYCCANYVEVLQNEGIAISMAEKGNPYENAIAERINRTFKEQLGMGETFQNYQQAMAKLIKAVEVYNHRRPHSSCDNMTPEQAHASSGVLKKHWKNRPTKAPMAEALPPSTPPGRFE